MGRIMAGQARDGRRVNPWRIAGWGLALALLATPLVAMQFTDEVRWGPLDFAVAAVLIGALGLGIEFAVRRSTDPWYRLGGALAALTAFLTIWVNLAVGFIDDEDNSANLLFAGVLLVALIGALAARFRAKGMAAAMAVTAAAQLLAAGAAYVLTGEVRPIEIVLTAAFAAPWLGSALLFRLAAVQEAALRA